mmetsp:Transcript_77146/g.226281  ORF Transcript_77146/g.226281 Transcript_77146/m.226281 type:complete len:325 (-) Transcript_77146:189-1163(-)
MRPSSTGAKPSEGPPEERLRKPSHREPAAEEATSIALRKLLAMLPGQPLVREDGGVRDVQRPQIWAPEGRAGGVSRRHRHDHVHDPVRPVSYHAPAAKLRVPEAALRVQDGAVRPARGHGERPGAVEAGGLVAGEVPDGGGHGLGLLLPIFQHEARICEEHAALRREANGVAALHASTESLYGEVCVEAVDGRDRLPSLLHAARSHEPALPVNPAVVQPRAKARLKVRGDAISLPLDRVIEAEAVFEGKDVLPALGDAEGARSRWQLEGLRVALRPARVVAPEPLPLDVDPAQELTPLVPQGTLSELVAARHAELRAELAHAGC